MNMKKGFTPLEILNSHGQNAMQSRKLAQMKSLTGFTLIEILLAVGIAATLITAASALLQITLQSRIKNQVIAEVEQQGVQVLHVIAQAGRNAETITAPAVGASGASLTLDVVTAANDPTVFDLSSGTIRITEGTGSAVSLTNSRVTASALTFQNLSRSGTPGTFRATFTLTHVNPTGRNEYAYTKTFYGSASLR
jgi:type II secretory pathway pseudopilin PulG